MPENEGKLALTIVMNLNFTVDWDWDVVMLAWCGSVPQIIGTVDEVARGILYFY